MRIILPADGNESSAGTWEIKYVTRNAVTDGIIK